jgi:hypothetical protein
MFFRVIVVLIGEFEIIGVKTYIVTIMDWLLIEIRQVGNPFSNVRVLGKD